MPRRLRLRLYGWYAVCAALLLGHGAWFIALRAAPVGERDRVVAAGLLALLGLIALLVLLLATTPPDAIRLPRRRSEAIVLSGSVALQVGATLVAAPRPVAHVIAGSLAAVAGTVLLLGQLRAPPRWSAWTAAVVAWNPLVVYETGVRGSLRGFALLLLAQGVTAAAAVWAARRATRRPTTL